MREEVINVFQLLTRRNDSIVNTNANCFENEQQWCRFRRDVMRMTNAEVKGDTPPRNKKDRKRSKADFAEKCHLREIQSSESA